ncbi:CAP domain-containing protein [Flavobacterium rhamnosiphilum]|uniref:CAP domain-containing protein n=2 Tax=Flavobacterium rhamnosiphilum TaxID=2541724 RepID=A0A4R5F976_9FLAO|nr:CAP domain-containing protein [Flavobacterium rhamnosiphilum]
MNSCSTEAVPVEPTTVTSPTPTPPVSNVVPPTTNASTYSYNAIETETLNLINAYRVRIGLKTLLKTDYISNKAQEHDNYMIVNNVLNHAGFDARSQDIMNVLRAKNVGENVAFNYSTAQAVFDGWLVSSGHKANIEGDFTHFGISIRVDSAGKKYYTNIFARI